MSSPTPLSLPSSSQPNAKPASNTLRKNAPASTNEFGLAGDVTSAVELNDWVDSLLNSLESRFEQMSDEVKERLQAATSRIDSLEQSISDLLQNPPVDGPGSPNVNMGQTS